jgi:hypothetical protein
MPRKSQSEPRLDALIAAIVSRDEARAVALVAHEPGLATAQVAKDRFYDAITHYAYSGDTALHLAAAAHAPVIVRDLLTAGARVDIRNRRGAAPLHYAADGAPGSPAWRPNAQAEVINMLIAAGADPNVLDKSGVAPLHRAVRTRCAEAVRALLAGGADRALPNGNGSTPLQLATRATGRGGSGSAAARDGQAAILALLTVN